MSDADCKWRWKDSAETVLVCTVHENEREVIRPDQKEEVVSTLKAGGNWHEPDKPDTQEERRDIAEATAQSKRDLATALTPTVQQGGNDMVEYQTMTGLRINLNVEGFQTLLCKMANRQQALFMLAWCKHNRIDPYANEAHFSIIDNQPVIQVSKDAWFKRMEAHPDFAGHDSGIIVKTTRAALTTAALIEDDDYVMSEAMKKALLAPKSALPDKLTVKKRGQFCDEDEVLVGGWCTILKRSKPAPILFQIPLKGWEQQKRNNEPNVFWERKQSFMIWKSALKNGARLAFPDLSGMLGAPEFDDTDHDGRLLEIPRTDGLSVEEQRKALLQTLHAAGADVPAPYGPYNHLALHHLAASLYGVDSLANLDVTQLSELCGQVQLAQTDDETARELSTHIPLLEPGNLKLKKTRTSDQMGVTK